MLTEKPTTYFEHSAKITSEKARDEGSKTGNFQLVTGAQLSDLRVAIVKDAAQINYAHPIP